MFQRVLMVCLGNICRSPMAECLLRAELRQAEGSVRVGSAGLTALSGSPADPCAVALLEERGLDLSSHRARQLTSGLVEEQDLILVMDSQIKLGVERRWPTARGKVQRLGHWSDFEVPDPYRKPREAFARSLRLIERGITEYCQKFWKS